MSPGYFALITIESRHAARGGADHFRQIGFATRLRQQQRIGVEAPSAGHRALRTASPAPSAFIAIAVSIERCSQDGTGLPPCTHCLRRGHIETADPDDLSKTACECYATAKARYDRSLGLVACPGEFRHAWRTRDSRLNGVRAPTPPRGPAVWPQALPYFYGFKFSYTANVRRR